jgi:hypothetical protein
MMWTASGPMSTVSRVKEYYPGIRRVCVAVAAGPSVGPSTLEQAMARRNVSRLLTGLCGAPAFEELSLSQQAASGSEIIIFPVGIDEPLVLTLLVRWLARAVHQANTGWNGRRVRLTVAAHEGITTLVSGVFGGPAVLKACALVTAPPLRAALDAAPAADLAVLFSSRLRDDLDGFNRCLDLSDFTPVELEIGTANEAGEPGWLLVPESDHLIRFRASRADSNESAGRLPG